MKLKKGTTVKSGVKPRKEAPFVKNIRRVAKTKKNYV